MLTRLFSQHIFEQGTHNIYVQTLNQIYIYNYDNSFL